MAIKCENCEKDAIYTSADPGVNPVNYCGLCLPSWLQPRAIAGQLPLANQEPSKKETKKETPAEVPAKEEVPAEEAE